MGLLGLKRRSSLTAQWVKNPPAMQEILVQLLGWEDPLEKGKATHFGILAWRIPWPVIVHKVATSQTRRCWQDFGAPGCPRRECIPILFTVATGVPRLMVLPPSSNPGVIFYNERHRGERQGGEDEAEDGV